MEMYTLYCILYYRTFGIRIVAGVSIIRALTLYSSWSHYGSSGMVLDE